MPEDHKQVRYDGRVAVVTGAGSGLGRDYALMLASRGAAVVVNDLGTDPNGRIASDAGESSAERVTRQIIEADGRAVPSHESCATRDGGEAIVDLALRTFGRLDIVIHNAGFLRNAPFETMSDEQIRSIMDVHLMAGFYVGQPAFRAMKQQGYGRFVLISSASGVFGAPWQANYAAAKTGLVGLMHSIAIEGRKHGILANVVLPCGPSRLGRGADEWPEDFVAISPEDYALVVPAIRNELVVPMTLWLASENCRSTHAIYTATAGRFARVFIGEGQGWLADQKACPTIEDIAAHLDEIEDQSRYVVPESLWDEFGSIARARRAAMA